MNSIYYTRPDGAVTLSMTGLKNFVESLGYAKYYLTGEKTTVPIYVYKNGNLIEPVIPIRVHEAVIKGLETRWTKSDTLPEATKRQVLDKLIASKYVTSGEMLITLSELDKPIISDTSDTAFFPFENGLATVTVSDIMFEPYGAMQGYIWASHVIDRPFEPLPPEESEKSDFFKFLCKITATRTPIGWTENQDRFTSLFSLIGYLLHSYKDPTNPRSVILMDSSLDGEPAGRTGKGLFVQGINKVRRTVSIDGKHYDTNNRFRFSSVTPDTRVLFIDDVGPKFNFENLFSVITEGIKVEEKFSPSFYIPFGKSPKIIISTNYALQGKGSSHEARKYEYALSNYYSDIHTPIHDFGRRFFDEWDPDQWNYFFNLMLYAVQAYLSKGVTLYADSTIDHKKLVADTLPQFVSWISEQGFKPGEKIPTAETYDRFVSHTGTEVDRKTFLGYLRSYALANSWHLVNSHSGNSRFFEFTPK